MSLWFFITWLGLGGAPPDIRRACFLSDCTLRPGLGLDLAFWVFHVWFFSGSPSGSGWGVLCFRHCLRRCAPDPPLLLGWRASLYRPDQRETNRNGRMLYPVGAVRSSWSAWAVRTVHIATGCNVKDGIVDPSLLLAPDAWAWGCWLSVKKRSVLCPLGSVHSCCRSVSSL